MISVDNLKVEFGVEPLFDHVSFTVGDHDRIALVGKNGAGKSTLLKILCGQQRATAGTVAVPNDTTVGYLPQVMRLSDDTTVVEETRKAFAQRTQMAAHIEQLQQQLAERTDYESEAYLQLVDQFTTAHDRFQLMGGDNYEAEMERTLTGLGFERDDLTRPTSEFSGGWRMRIELAKILLQRPDVLLLDEPTNHLDIESIEWLEQFLLQSAKAVVLVSHDRAFINNVTTRTLEITAHHVEDYRVSYDQYLTLRQERHEQQMRAWQNQQKEIADTKAFIERFRYQATKAVQVQSRIKQLEKIVPVQVDEVDRRAMHLKFPPCLRSGDFPVVCQDVGKQYGEKTVFSHVDLAIRRGEKVAFVGKNGEGKSTLVKCIMGQLEHMGKLRIAHNVQIGYFAQNQAQLLDDQLTIRDTIDQVATGEMRLKINDLLGAFMFGGETADKPVRVLSGGERSRLAMIRLLLEPVNLLILDEPTNHLDIPSKEVLKEAIQAFDGTAIIVSHDREFLDGLVTKVYEFAHGHVREHLGGIYDYLQAHRAETISQALQGSAPKNAETNTPKAEKQEVNKPVPSAPKQDYQQHKEQQKQLRKAQRNVEEAEKRIEQLEAQRAVLDEQLLKPENAANMELVNQYTATQQLLDQENERWMQLSEVLEQLQQQLNA